MYIKHSKFKNTGILFEILVKKITGDTLSGKNSPAIKVIKEYFVNTELGKEYKLYETLFSKKNLSESKASIILDTILEQSKKLNRRKLKNEKYNLIKELRSHYDVEDLFKTKLNDYKAQASLYTLLEIYNSVKPTNPQQEAGIRTEPPPSEPCAIVTIPAATAAAEPPDEPPEVTAKFHGFREGFS